MKIRGWVYVITNKAMPGLVKVGYSTKDPVLRAGELGGTGIPYAYEVAFDALVEQPRDVEQLVHANLTHLREGKEWFRCDISTAVFEIRKCASVILNESVRDTEAVAATDVEKPIPKKTSTPTWTEKLTPYGRPASDYLPDKCCWYPYGCNRTPVYNYKGYQLCLTHWKDDKRLRFNVLRNAD
jgi:hypothetical protein